MEEYKNLNWSIRRLNTDTQKEEYFNYYFSDAENDVFYCHLNEIDDIHFENLLHKSSDKSNENLPIDPRTKKVINELIIDCTKKKSEKLYLFKKFPVYSKLTKLDHAACIRALKSFNKFEIPLKDNNDDKVIKNCSNDQERYFALSEVRAKEKQLFLTFLKNYSLTQNQRYNYLNDNYEKFVIEKWRININLMKNIYVNKVYNLQTALSVTYATDANLTINIDYKSTIKETGYVSKIKCNISYKPLTIDFNECYKALIDKTGILEADYLNHKIHSINSLETYNLASNNNVDIVATTSSLFSIINTFDDDCEDVNIPFTIIRNDNYSDKNILFIEKPLPKKYLSKIKRNLTGYKYAIRSKIASFKCNDQYCLDRKEFYKFEDNLVQTSFNKAQVNNYNLETIDDFMNNVKLQNDGVKIVEFPLKTGLNYSYRIWEIAESEDKNTEASNNINLLIRTKQDLCTQHNNKIQYYNLSTKLEYQTEFGCEKMTKSELIKEWCRLYFRPDTLTKRFRVDIKTGILISMNTLTLQQIEYELKRLYELTPKWLLQRLWSILKFLYKFPKNTYILNINKVQILSNKIMIYALVNADNDKIHGKLLNINEIYKNIDYERKMIEIHKWLPIDDVELTVLHKRATVMPCGLPPKLLHQKNKINIKLFNEIERNFIKKRFIKKQALVQNIIEKQILQKKKHKFKKKKNRKNLKTKEEFIVVNKSYDLMKEDTNYQVHMQSFTVDKEVIPTISANSSTDKIIFKDYMKNSGVSNTNSIMDSD